MNIFEATGSTLAEASRQFIDYHQVFEYTAEHGSENLQQLVDEIEQTAFIQLIEGEYVHYLTEVHDALNIVHGTSSDLSLPFELEEITYKRQFEWMVLYIIACAIAVYAEPEYFSADGEDAGALKQVRPNKSVMMAARKLQFSIKKQGLNIGDWENGLVALVNGAALYEQLEPSKDSLERMVREIILVSGSRLVIKNKGKNRFSTQAIIAISKIVGHKPSADIRKVQRIHSHLEDINTVALSNNIENLRDD